MMGHTNIVGATPRYEKNIMDALSRLPTRVLAAADLREVRVSEEPRHQNQLGFYEHGTRSVRVLYGLDPLTLVHALFHEVGHAVDDLDDKGHFFSLSSSWRAVGGMDPIESFAINFAEFLLNPYRKTREAPDVARHMNGVLSYLTGRNMTHDSSFAL